MFDDRDLAAILLSSLQARLGVIQRMLIGTLRYRQPLQTDTLTGMVHHRKHVREAFVLLTDQVTNRATLIAKTHNTGRTAVNTQLVLKGYRFDIVTLGRVALLIQQIQCMDPSLPSETLGLVSTKTLKEESTHG